jgi:hypothetical protein
MGVTRTPLFLAAIVLLSVTLGNFQPRISFAQSTACADNSNLYPINTGVSNSNGCVYYADPQLRVLVNCSTSSCNIQQIYKKMPNGSWRNTLFGSGYYWAASPKSIPDAVCGNGFAQGSCFNDGPSNWNIENITGGVRINWYKDVRKYNDPAKPVGLDSWGSITLLHNTSYIKLWHRFKVKDIAAWDTIYPAANRQLDAFFTSLDVKSSFNSVYWPSTDSSRSSSSPLLRSYSAIGGDWVQPQSSGWNGSSCPNGDLYGGQTTPHLFIRNVLDARCHPRQPSNYTSIWVTRVASTQVNQGKVPYMMHYDTSDNLGVVRVLTQNANQRLTMQVFDNATFNIGGYSSSVSWDWGDGLYEAWPLSGWAAPTLSNGWEKESNEELWVGQGTTSTILNWVGMTYNIYR